MSVNISTTGNVAVVTATGRLDTSSVETMEALVLESLDGETPNLLFDFGELEYINSSGLRVLVLAYQRLSPKGGAVSVCGLKDYIREVFEISGYDKIFSIAPDRAAAMAKLGG